MRHESTRIYAASLDLNHLCARVVERMPLGCAFLSDQLRRAGASVTLNFAEGSRRTSKAERQRFFTIAASSAAEVSAIVDVAHAYRAVTAEERAQAKRLCEALSRMLRVYR